MLALLVALTLPAAEPAVPELDLPKLIKQCTDRKKERRALIDTAMKTIFQLSKQSADSPLSVQEELKTSYEALREERKRLKRLDVYVFPEMEMPMKVGAAGGLPNATARIQRRLGPKEAFVTLSWVNSASNVDAILSRYIPQPKKAAKSPERPTTMILRGVDFSLYSDESPIVMSECYRVTATKALTEGDNMDIAASSSSSRSTHASSGH
jgi:hypothetical protein